MQNLMIGKSGAGKGYEVCAYHILTALSQGRKVITNIPLNIEKWSSIDPTYPALIEMRKRAMPIRGTWEPTREEGAFNLFSDQTQSIQPPPTARPFAGVWDYYSDWRHPVDGVGPLFVVDEAQNVIPRAKTDVQVEEWSALHRHFVCDVLWVTQSYGKLSQAIRDNVQMVYRLTKKVAWGQPDKYIRKVQDGIRGEVLNVTERAYNPAFFGLWRSHTQGDSGKEYNAVDIVPLWKHWSFKGAAICLVIVISGTGIMLTRGDKTPPPAPSLVVTEKAVDQPAQQARPAPAITAVPRGPEQILHPYQGYTMHLSALQRGERTRPGELVPTYYLNGYVTISQNGQPLRQVSFRDLEDAGYSIRYHSLTVVSLEFQGVDVGYVVSGLPQVSLAGKTPGKQTGG
jgi:zona occludens toxin